MAAVDPNMKRQILIAGPGRSGTTLLIRILDAAGLDTGLEELKYHPQARAGLEGGLHSPPRVVKNPGLSGKLREMIENGKISARHIEWLVVPLRSLDEAAASRANLSLRQGDLRAPGGLSGTTRPSRQGARLAETTYGLIETAALYELPLVVLEYPRFAQDSEYAFRRLKPLLDGQSQEAFEVAWRSVVEPSLVRIERVEMPRLADLRVLPLQLRHFAQQRVAPLIRKR